jgi:aldehyde:ferredoxin oxidoreductase
MAELKFKKIKTLAYKKPAIEKGYTNQSLYVNLSRPGISVKPVTDKMKEVFIGQGV